METTGPKPRLHSFGFLDETGLLHSPEVDRVFGLGLLVSSNPKELHRAIIILKNKRRYHKELKFSDVSKQNLPIYTELIDVFFSCTNLRFHVLVVDKATLTEHQRKKAHQAAYNKFAAQLIAGSIDKGRSTASEYITILADDISTRKDDNFEKVVREKVKKKNRRNALFGICRLESHAVSEIQMVDVLLGLIAYGFKIKYGLIPGGGAQLRLLKHLQKKLNISHVAEEQKIKLPRGELIEIIEDGKIK